MRKSESERQIEVGDAGERRMECLKMQWEWSKVGDVRCFTFCFHKTIPLVFLISTCVLGSTRERIVRVMVVTRGGGERGGAGDHPRTFFSTFN